MSRSKVFSLVPIHIHYEHKSVWDMTIIDPPGVASFNIFDEWYQFNLMSKAVSIIYSNRPEISLTKSPRASKTRRMTCLKSKIIS
jgi:hypothetical protein